MQCICIQWCVSKKVFSIYCRPFVVKVFNVLNPHAAQERQLRKHPRGQFAVYELGSIFSSNCITPKQTKGFNLAGWVNTFWQNARFGFYHIPVWTMLIIYPDVLSKSGNKKPCKRQGNHQNGKVSTDGLYVGL